MKGPYFQAKVDHSALTYIWKARTESPTQRLKKILEKLQEFNFNLSYEKGIHLKIADALPRNLAIIDIPGTPIRLIALANVARKLLGSTLDEMNRENLVENNMDQKFWPNSKVETALLINNPDVCFVSTRSSKAPLTPAGDFSVKRSRPCSQSTTAPSPVAAPRTLVPDPAGRLAQTAHNSLPTTTSPTSCESKRISSFPNWLQYATLGGKKVKDISTPPSNQQ